MPNGANSVHKQLRTELEDYIKSQYFGKSPILLSALSKHIDDEGLLYQKPFIESSPAYVTVPNGIETASIDPWLKNYFGQLAASGIGVFPSPFAHQISALEAASRGEIYLWLLVLALVKRNASCGRFLLRWRWKRETLRIPGQSEGCEPLLCTP